MCIALLGVPLFICWMLPASEAPWMMFMWPMFAVVSLVAVLICLRHYPRRVVHSLSEMSSTKRVGLRFGLRSVTIMISLVCLVLAIYRLLPRDGQGWIFAVSPLLLTFGILTILADSPRRMTFSFALAHAVFAGLCFGWASMTDDGELSFARFVPVVMSNIHLVLLLAWLRITSFDSFADLIALSIVGTAWWAGIGYFVGRAKLAFQRGCRVA
jgi:hypothetical protein